MSLIILKNTDSQPPNKFGNDFVNTITIKKNSEVALHSISFNRVDGYSVNDYFFYIYHGPELDIDSEVIDTFQSSVMRPVQIALQNGVYSIDELVAHIQAMLRLQDDHPNYQHEWLVTKKTDIAGDIEGIQLVCDQIPPAPKSTSATPPTSDSDSDSDDSVAPDVDIPFPSKLVNVSYGDGGTDIVYNSATGEVSRAASSPRERIWARTSKPLNLNSGHLVFELTSPSNVCQEQHNAFGIGRNYHPDQYTDTIGSFFDVQVRYLVSGEVLLEQQLLTPSGFVKEEIEYWNDTTNADGTTNADPDSAFKTLTGPMNILTPPTGHTGTYDGICMFVENSITTVLIGDAAETDYTNTAKWKILARTKIKPVSYANIACFGKCYVPNNTYNIKITCDTVETYSSVYGAEDYDVDWSSLSVSYPDISDNKLMGDTAVGSGALEDHNGIFINRGLSIKTASVQRHIPYQCVLISGFVDAYEFYETSQGANMNKIMGYESIHVESVVSAATSAKCTFTPTDTISPKLGIVKGEDITFVRLNNLGQMSHNGAMKGVSKIICDVPRYLPTSTSGRMWYAPPEKTYLSLGNSADITLSRLDVELVNANELLVGDLTDDTVVVLHVRIQKH
jgi:hypothetical protein